MPLRFTRAGLIGTLVALVVAAACVRLGIWQLHRLEVRQGRNALIEARMAAPPVRLSAPVGDTAGLLYRRIEVGGAFDHARSVVLPGRSHRGAPGVHLLTPLRLEGRGEAVLVNRGWVPSPDAATIDIGAFDAPATVRLEALIVPFPYRPGVSATEPMRTRAEDVVSATGADPEADGAGGRILYDLDVAGLIGRLPYAVEPIYVQALPGDGAREGYPLRLEAPTLGDGPHLGYAIEWFSFALIALVGWTVLLLRRG